MSGRPSLEAALRAASVVDDTGLDQARSYASSKGVPLERAVVALGLATEEDVYRCVAKAAGLPFVDPRKAPVTPELLGRLPREQIEQHGVLPVIVKDGSLFVAIDDPLKTFLADDLAFIAGCTVRCAIAPPKALKEAVRRALGSGGKAADSAARVDAGDPDAPIIRLVEKTIAEALEQRASDIHVEPFEDRLRVRYRVDGILREHAVLPPELHGPLTSRLKILAAMDIAEKRKPQDGRIDIAVSGRHIDIRTSVLPSNHGETVVMRLLDKEHGLLSLEALGFVGEDLARFESTIKRPNGVVLVTGPTGSGKTTTLYAALRDLNRPDVKIITAEDPVEFNLAGINQCQVRSGIGLSFARILRAMLRQAPNVILVGEIRDRETAEIAVQAALTGHLVFSTLHTNDATSAITRLIDMGVKPFLVSAAIQAVMAQRLVRVLCERCKEAYRPTVTELRTIGVDPNRIDDVQLHRAVGCDACEGNGYRGRIGIFELLVLDTTLREMIFRGEPTLRLREYARRSGGMRRLAEDGARKVLDGRTTIEELLRVTAAV